MGLNLSDPSVAQAADDLYQRLWQQGIETLYDDRRDEAAGVKFNDADLLGLPVRLVVSPRSLRQDSVEVKERQKQDAESVGVEDVIERVAEILLPSP